MQTIFKISGMSCEHCERHVREALEEIEGVASAQVSHTENTATVEHADNVSLDAMKEAIVEVGYEVQ